MTAIQESTPTTAEVLRAAADLIRKNGWHQGEYFEFKYVNGESTWDDESDEPEPDAKPAMECKVCSLGAINAIIWGDPIGGNDNTEPAEALARVLTLDLVPEASVPNWNDDPERTVEEVLEAFEQAAQRAEAGL